ARIPASVSPSATTRLSRSSLSGPRQTAMEPITDKSRPKMLPVKRVMEDSLSLKMLHRNIETQETQETYRNKTKPTEGEPPFPPLPLLQAKKRRAKRRKTPGRASRNGCR